MKTKTRDNIIAGAVLLACLAILILAVLLFGGYGAIIVGLVLAYLVAEC